MGSARGPQTVSSPRALAPSVEGPGEVWRARGWVPPPPRGWAVAPRGPVLPLGSPGRGGAPSEPPPLVRLSCCLVFASSSGHRGVTALPRRLAPAAPAPPSAAPRTVPGRGPCPNPALPLLLRGAAGTVTGGGRWVSESRPPSGPRLEPLHSPPHAPGMKGRVPSGEGGPAAPPKSYRAGLSPRPPGRLAVS